MYRAASELRRLAQREPDRAPAARMQAIAGALEGLTRAEAARLAGMKRQVLRDAVLRFNAEGLDGLHDRPRSGRPARPNKECQEALRKLVLDGFSARLGADEHAVMVTDQAGWHVAHALAVPGNVTLVHMPPYSPELNPVERIMRWSPFFGQVVKLGSPMRDGPDDGQAETIFGGVQGQGGDGGVTG